MSNLIPGFKNQLAIQTLAKAGLVGEPIAELFRYAKIKGNTLFFVFTHNTAKMEFGYAREWIRQNLRKAYKRNIAEYKELGIIFEKIAAAVVIISKRKESKPQSLLYREKSDGNFSCSSKDPEFLKRVEALRETIKENRHASK